MVTERLWCDVCGHGVDGIIGDICPECVTKRRGNGCGELKTPDQAVKDHAERAAAIKLARNSSTIRGHKTLDEKMSEMKKQMMKELKRDFDIVPKGQAFESKVQPAVDTTDVVATPTGGDISISTANRNDSEKPILRKPQTVAEYRANKKSTKSK